MENDFDAVLDPSSVPKRGRAPKADLLSAPEQSEERQLSEAEIFAAQPKAVPSFVKTETAPAVRVRMRVTAKGDMEISTGGHFGFERYGMFAEFFADEKNARHLYNKGWAEPLDDPRETVRRWEKENAADRMRDMKSLAARDRMMEHGAAGVGADASWNG
jgi:hypothetical protein